MRYVFLVVLFVALSAPLSAQDTQADSVLIITQTQAAPPVQVEVSDNDTTVVRLEIQIAPACGGCDVDAQAVAGGGWFDGVRSHWPWMLISSAALVVVWHKWKPATTIVNSVVNDGDVSNVQEVDIRPGGEDDCLPDGPYPQ